MAKAIATSKTERRAAYEPLYDIDPETGATIEVFYADRELAESFGARGAGWFWWSGQPGCLPVCTPIGPFGTSYRAYRGALDRGIASNLPRVSVTTRRSRSPLGDRMARRKALGRLAQ